MGAAAKVGLAAEGEHAVARRVPVYPGSNGGDRARNVAAEHDREGVAAVIPTLAHLPVHRVDGRGGHLD